jgi:hypothetical protein
VKKAFLAACGLSLSLVAAEASAAVGFSFEETGGNVVGTLSGSLDLSGAKLFDTFSAAQGAILPRFGLVTFTGAGVTYEASGPGDFGQGLSEFTMSSGSPFHVSPDLIGVSSTYISAQTLAGTISFLGTDFASLGITPGTYVYTLFDMGTQDYTGDTVTLRFTPGAVIPLPATLPLLLAALGLAALVTRRRG